MPINAKPQRKGVCLKVYTGVAAPVVHPPFHNRRCAHTTEVAAAVVHHLVRVPRPRPSRKHPLAGLWRGRWQAGWERGVSVIQVAYDFSGSAARIVATQVNAFLL